MLISAPESQGPSAPESLKETGLAETLIEQLLLKILYYRGELYGQGLSGAVGLKFSVIQPLVEALVQSHQIQVRRSLGFGSFGSVFALTDEGRIRARNYIDDNQYGGAAPVTLLQYEKMVRRQRPRAGWLTKEAIRHALRGMVVSERLLSQVGPAVSAGNSLLLYGKPGDGKTFLIESLTNLERAPVFVPHAVECQGNIIRVYDPVYHKRIEEEEPSEAAVLDAGYDRRWAKCERPFIMSGGELSLDMLDLRYNRTSKVYEAPFQLKANNGIYLIDDFGRQRATPIEVFNRWIVPMERRADYLTFVTGGRMTVPFETFLVFSTNLNPADFGDEAFLRRIQYKILLRGPSEDEFIQIFENVCAFENIACGPALVRKFIQKRYRPARKPFRRCQPRDLLLHALNLIHFENLPPALDEEILDRSFENCFLHEHEEDLTQ